jgi:hypothetical protein
MTYQEPLFKGLIIDEFDRVVSTGKIGVDPCYIVNDSGFMRHIISETVDREVLKSLGSQINGNEGLIADQAAKLTGHDDLFSHAFIESQLKNLDKQFDLILQTGLPEETRAYLGMMGFKVVIDIHGNVIRIDQPAGQTGDEGPGDNE